MAVVQQSRETVSGELDGLVELLAQLTPAQWELPTRCEGWNVEDLARHVAGSPSILNEGLRRMLEGVESAATPAPPHLDDRTAVVESLAAGRDETAALLATLHDDQLNRPCPFPFGTVPLSFALQVLAFEYGGHRNDLLAALGRDEPLPTGVAQAAAAIVPQLGDKVPESPLGYRLEGRSVAVSLLVRDGQWQPGEDPSVPTCTVAGTDSAVMLFATGRLAATDPSLQISGETAAAGDFKRWFPGP